MRVIEEEIAADRLATTAGATTQAADQSYLLALNSALGMLARREHSKAELARKLNRKGFAADSVASVLEYLITEKLQSDARFAESYVRGRIGRGYGPMHIRGELSQRGVDELLVEESLTRSAEFWIDIAQRARAKKFKAELCLADESGSLDDICDPAEASELLEAPEAFGNSNDRFSRANAEKALWNKQARFLARRGFPADLIYRVLGSRG